MPKHKEPRQARRVAPGDTIRYRLIRGVRGAGVGIPTYGYPDDPAEGWKEVEGAYPYKDWNGQAMIMLKFTDTTTKRIPARAAVQVRT